MIIETRINTNTTGIQFQSSVAALTNGGYVVTWTSWDQSGLGGIYGQRYDANSVAQGAEFRVNTYTGGSQSTPASAALTNGGYVVTWSSWPQDGDDGGIYAQRYDANGVAKGGEFRVNTYTADDQSDPSITALINGGFVVTWVSSEQDGSEEGIYGQRYDANGVAQGVEFRANINDTAGGQLWGPAAALADGGFVVIWITDYSGIHGQRYNANGIAQGAEFHANIQNKTGAQSPSVAALTDGGFVVIWSAEFATDGIRGQRYDASGTPIDPEFLVNTDTTGGHLLTSVTGLSGGGFVVTWTSGSQDGYPSDYGIYGQRYDAGGIKQGTEFRINTYTAYDQLDPSVAALADGGFVVTWESQNQDGSSYGIYGQRYDANGDVFYANPLLISTAGNDVLTGTLSGDDTVTYAYAAAPVTVSLTIGSQQNTGGAGFDTLINIENLIGSDYDDMLTGDTQNNVLIGGTGNDVLKGWSGADTLIGGLGNDSYFVENADDVIIEHLNEGTDSVSSRVTYSLIEGIENLTLTGVLAINGTGNVQANILTGNAAANQLNGGAGKDTLIGKAGNDTLNGGSGNDTLNGGAGNDTLDGGGGANVLTGGRGNDIFSFTVRTTSKVSIDKITDYNVADDTIQLENSVFKALTKIGVLADNQFRIGTQALDANDFIIYNNVMGELLYDADGSGGIAAVQIAMVGIGLAMTSADIVVI
jgi:Ca2+-binding RTX toxin-like protein